MLLLLLAGSILVYLPGLSGPFIFDDIPNLEKLHRFGQVQDWPSLLSALGNGIAGPLGRPVALLSFLMNDTGWPTASSAFKYTNMLLHALNGVLLFWLILVLQGAIETDRRRSLAIAFMAAAFWAFHPLWVSTTLYVVQRMAMLATTFSLAAMILFVKGRLLVAAGRTWPGLVRIGIGLGGFGTLGLLSKENAAFLPLQLLLLEFVLFRSRRYAHLFPAPPRLYRLVVWAVLVVPTLIVVGWLLQDFPNAEHRAVVSRGFSMWQRALTENRILFEYLQLLFLPRDATQGVYYDDYQASAGLLQPWTTLPATFGVLALVGFGWWLRHRYVPGALAILFFLASHLLETWAVALELFYEHRNYLPALLLFWPLAQGLASRRVAASIEGWGTPLFAGALLVFLLMNTLSRSVLWGDSQQLALSWAEKAPKSERAQGHAIGELVLQGYPLQARSVLLRALEHQPQSRTLLLTGLQLACVTEQRDDWVERAEAELSHGGVKGDFSLAVLERVLDNIESGWCRALTPVDVRRVAEALLRNPNTYVWNASAHAFTYLVGRASLQAGDPDQALAAFLRMNEIIAELDAALRGASLLGAAGHPREALSLLDAWENSKRRRINLKGTGRSDVLRAQRRRMMQAELERLRAVLAEDLRNMEGER